MHDRDWWLVEKPILIFYDLKPNWTLFAICNGSGAMRRNVYSSAVFTGLDLFVFIFYLDMVVPINHSWRQKAGDTELPDGKDCTPLRSLVLTQLCKRCTCYCYGKCRDGFAVAYTFRACKARFAARCKNQLYSINASDCGRLNYSFLVFFRRTL